MFESEAVGLMQIDNSNNSFNKGYICSINGNREIVEHEIEEENVIVEFIINRRAKIDYRIFSGRPSIRAEILEAGLDCLLDTGLVLTY